MTSRANRTRTRKDLSKADLKAYESRRAAERRRIGTGGGNPLQASEPARVPQEHSFAMTRDEEFIVIKSDLVRMLTILAVLAVALVVLTLVLR